MGLFFVTTQGLVVTNQDWCGNWLFW